MPIIESILQQIRYLVIATRESFIVLFFATFDYEKDIFLAAAKYAYMVS